jgi:propionyl-CoA carboxylase alpha chain
MFQVTHNIPLLSDIFDEKRFRSGDITTKYLPETYPEGFMGNRVDMQSWQSRVFAGAKLTNNDQLRLIAITGALQARRVACGQMFTNQHRQKTADHGECHRSRFASCRSILANV